MRLKRTGKKVIVRPFQASDYLAWKKADLSSYPESKNIWDIGVRRPEKVLTRSEFFKLLRSQKKNRKEDYFLIWESF